MAVQFPLFVFAKDDGHVVLIETPDSVLYHLEPIDIDNNEYLFWDSTGAGVSLSIGRDGICSIAECTNSMSLSDALSAYCASVGVAAPAEAAPIDIWNHIQSQRPPTRNFWTRFRDGWRKKD